MGLTDAEKGFFQGRPSELENQFHQVVTRTSSRILEYLLDAATNQEPDWHLLKLDS